MKRFFISGIIILNALNVFSQNHKADSLDSQTFRKVLNQQFTNLVTGQAKNSVGNFASLDLKEPEVAFAGSAIFKKSSVLTIKASGGVTDGFFSIFSNSSLNTKVSLAFQYHWLGSGKKMLTYDNASFELYKNRIDTLTNKYQLDSIALAFGRDSIELRVKQDALGDKKKELLKAIDTTKASARKKDSLKYELAVLQFKLNSVDTAIVHLKPLFRRVFERDNQFSIDSQAVKPELKIYGFQLGWWSLGYKVRNDAFKLFDAKLGFSDQLDKQSFVTHEASVQYSKYNWSRRRYKSNFWQAGVAFSLTHNLDELTKTEITEVKNYGPNVNDRTSTEKYNVYFGTYEKDLKGLRLYYDYYRFLFDNNVAALHAFPDVMIRDKSRPLYNAGLGFLLSFKDDKEEKDETARVNIELYYKFLDLFKYSETTDKFFERNEIGIRFAFPIKFKTK